MKRILLATGIKAFDKVISSFSDFEVVGTTNFKSDLISDVSKFKPDLVVVSGHLGGKENIIELLVRLSQENDSVRIIYLTNDLDMSKKDDVNKLGTLVLAGIYDISHKTKMTKDLLHYIIANPKNKNDVSYLLKYFDLTTEDNQESIFIEEESTLENVEDEGFSNVYAISSIKPGTGKSFLSSNIATTIANFGVKKNGKKPKVALIEADLQNLSIGTLLQVEDDKRNLKTAMNKISTILDSEGNLIDDENKIGTANEFIKKCFLPYKNVPNLEVLAGSELSMEDVEDITANHYSYLVTLVSEEYDVVIIDTNSSLAHITTYPLLQMAKGCYYILNLDFNNVRNNARYKDELIEIGIFDKVKYILNQDIEGSQAKDLLFTKDLIDKNTFKFEAIVPNLPLPIFLNHLYEGVPVCLGIEEETAKARYEIAKVSNQIWPIDNLTKLKEEVEYVEEKQIEKSKKNKKGFFK